MAAALLVIVAASAGAFLVLFDGGDGASSDDGARTAVIVDQLSLTQPNPDFIASARRTLAKAGYVTDYFPGEEVTVDLYRTLPDRGYDLVLLRVHAGITNEIDASSGEKTKKEYVSLFTGEPYVTGRYPEEQLNRLGRASYHDGAAPLFGIGPEFVRKSMEGDFNGALVVMMGCDGLRSQITAEAFLDKGASAFVSWTKPVSADHTDAATQALLEKMLIEGMPTAKAVKATADEVGPDPAFEAELRVLEAKG